MFIPNSRRVTLLICLVAALTTTGQGSMELVYPLNLHRIGVALPLVGAAIAVGNLGQLISRFPGGAAYSLGRARLLNVGWRDGTGSGVGDQTSPVSSSRR